MGKILRNKVWCLKSEACGEGVRAIYGPYEEPNRSTCLVLVELARAEKILLLPQAQAPD